MSKSKPVKQSITRPRVPGSKTKAAQAKVARAYQDMFLPDNPDRYKIHLRGRRVGPKPSLSDYEGSKF